MLFPKPRPRIFDKRDDAREREQAKRLAYAMVAARDQRRCRCCERSGSYEASGDKGLHRHHIQFRSKGGADTPENLVTLCAWCHALLHARQLWIEGTNADRKLRFEVHEAAVVDLFGVKTLPPQVRIVTEARRQL